jgi:hypothetical protein
MWAAHPSAWLRVYTFTIYGAVPAGNKLDFRMLSQMVDCDFDPGFRLVLNSVHAAPLESVLPVKLVTPG